MSKFKDRAGRGLNKRILEVESVERNHAGEISKIYAKVSRNDVASISGTPLNATTLNTIIYDMIIKNCKILEKRKKPDFFSSIFLCTFAIINLSNKKYKIA